MKTFAFVNALVLLVMGLLVMVRGYSTDCGLLVFPAFASFAGAAYCAYVWAQEMKKEFSCN